MDNIHLMIFEGAGVNRDELIGFMEASDAIVDYHTSLPKNLVIVVSPMDAQELAGMFHAAAGLRIYMFARLDPERLGVDVFGWMTPTLWDFVARHSQPTPVAPIIQPMSSTTAESPRPPHSQPDATGHELSAT